MEIVKKQAREFLDSITKKDKVAVIHHDDLDGFASGILLYELCKDRGCEVEAFPKRLTNRLFDNLIKELEKFDVILITDIAPFYIADYLKSLNKRILYIDHHQKDVDISENVLEWRAPKDKYFPASKMCWEITKDVNKEREWLAIAGIIADVGYKYPENDEIINSFLERENISLEEYQKSTGFPINNLFVYFTDNLKKAFEILEKVKDYRDMEEIKSYGDEVEKEIQYFISDFKKNHETLGKADFYFFSPKFKIKSIVATNLSLSNPKKLMITLTPSYLDKEILDISARSQNGDVKVNLLLKEAMKDLKNCASGGHERAAGGNIMKKDLEKFKENLKKF